MLESVLRTVVAITLAVAIALSVPVALEASVRPGDCVIGEPVSTALAPVASAAPDLDMASGYLGTVDGRELWSRDADKRRPMASTTKIMTAVVVLEAGVSLDEEVTVSAAAAKVGQARYNLKAGDVRTVRQLLEEMLVKSGNDAAAALAEHVGGSETAFVGMMNAKAAALGLKDTHYTNPHGLDDADHYTSARDLAALARFAMRDEEFRRVVRLRSVDVTSGGSTRTMENTNLLLGDFEGVIGIKTGMTDDAGWCLVAQAERDTVRLLGVILGTRGETARVRQSRELLQWGFDHYRTESLTDAGESMGLIPVSDYLDVTVPAEVSETTSAVVFDLDGEISRTVELEPSVRAPVSKGDVVGKITLQQGGRVITTVDVIAAKDIEAPSVWERIRVWAIRTWRRVAGSSAEPAAAS